ncbi:MAG: substrate-binding domain-containing protein [Anaerolineales bacterium]|nr:substrate-binding domain-containing protein [Anaerolineales bacterium]
MSTFTRLAKWIGVIALLTTTACGTPATPTPSASQPSATTTAVVATEPPEPTATTAPTQAPTEPATATSAPATATTAPTEAPTTAPAATETVAPTVAAASLPTAAGPRGKLILATTTSTADTGLLAAILPYFEARENLDVQVIAVGTGQALAIGAKGDADVVLVHARSQEDKFVADGFGIDRRDVMYNDFVIVGPVSDPAGIRDLPKAKDALAQIAAAAAPFASRGDGSGTHTKERSLWTAAGITPASGANGYVALGQGMGETLTYANETGSYTLTDRGTWLARQSGLTNLVLLVGGTSVKTNPDTSLYNPYGVIAVNPAKFPKANYEKAALFIEWITSLSIQRRIYEFGRDLYGQSLFYPVAQTP